MTDERVLTEKMLDRWGDRIDSDELLLDYTTHIKRDVFGSYLLKGDLVVFLASGLKTISPGKYKVNYEDKRWKIIDVLPEGMGVDIEIESLDGQKMCTPFFNVVKLIFKEEKKINTYYEVRLEFRLIKREEDTGNFISATDVNIPGEPVLFESNDIFTAHNFIDKVQHMKR